MTGAENAEEITMSLRLALIANPDGIVGLFERAGDTMFLNRRNGLNSRKLLDEAWDLHKRMGEALEDFEKMIHVDEEPEPTGEEI